MDRHLLSAELEEAVRLLRAHEPVAIPTETVYGLAAPFDDEHALRRVFALKGRPLTDPLIVHVSPPGADPIAALHATGVVDGDALSLRACALVARLAAAFWPGPLTLVLPRGRRVPLLATGGLESVAVRVPRHPLTLELLRAIDVPLCAPSANRFGRVSPTDAESVRKELGEHVRLVLDGGPCAVGLESTVVRVSPDGAELCVLRPGGVPVEALAVVAGEDVVVGGIGLFWPLAGPIAAIAEGDARVSPGLRESHYAPSKPIARLQHARPEALIDALRSPPSSAHAAGVVGLLLPEGDGERWVAAVRAEVASPRVLVEVLSPAGDELQAAQRLFAALRALDEGPATRLFVAPCERVTGLWCAIDDRLRRAAAKRSDNS